MCRGASEHLPRLTNIRPTFSAAKTAVRSLLQYTEKCSQDETLRSRIVPAGGQCPLSTHFGRSIGSPTAPANRGQDGQAGHFSTSARAFKAPSEMGDRPVTSAKLCRLETVHRPRGPAVRAVDLQACAKAHNISEGSNVLSGHGDGAKPCGTIREQGLVVFLVINRTEPG